MKTFLVTQPLRDKIYVGVDCSALQDALLELAQELVNQQGRIDTPELAHALANVARESNSIGSKPLLNMKKI